MIDRFCPYFFSEKKMEGSDIKLQEAHEKQTTKKQPAHHKILFS